MTWSRERFTSVTKMVAGSPGQARHVPALMRSLDASPLEVGLPWLAFDVIDWLDKTLTPTMRLLEFGGGGSTRFFAERVASVTTVEHDPEWIDALRDAFDDDPKVTVLSGRADNDYADYIARVQEFPKRYFDFVLVDGRARVKCVRRSIPHLKPGGFLMLDDTDRANYAPAAERLAGWERREFRGISPYKLNYGYTTVWRKPRRPRRADNPSTAGPTTGPTTTGTTSIDPA